MQLKTIAVAITFALSTAGMQAVAQDYGSDGGGAEGQGQTQQGQGQGQGQGQSQGQGMGSPEQQQSTDFSDDELKNFVELQDKIGGVREEYVSEIESAESEDKARELQQEAQSEMVEVIENEGMSVEEYNAIAVAYNSNPEIQERVDSMSDD